MKPKSETVLDVAGGSAPQSARSEKDRASSVRSALRTLVAQGGFHGASMSAVAKEAGVATGTAYVHYDSKEDLILAAYIETKLELADVCEASFNHGGVVEERFISMWLGVFEHLRTRPDEANFLLQVETSPYAQAAHDVLHSDEANKLTQLAKHPDLQPKLSQLPLKVLWTMGVVPAIWLAAQQSIFEPLDEQGLRRVALGCWRSITTE